MGKLTLRLLGTPEIYLDGRLLRFPTRKAQALMIFLAVEGGLHSRASLTTLFWPDSDPELARAAFRNTLVRLRRVLQNCAHLTTEGDLLGLTWDDPPDIDVHRVELLAAAVSKHSLVEVEVLTAQVNLTRGDFLNGFTLDDSIEFDDWTSLKREYYFRLIEEIFDKLTNRQQNEQPEAIKAGIETILHWINHNSMSEPAYQRLINRYLEAGDRTSALRTYQNCCKALETQLGIVPSSETRALFMGIQAEPDRQNRPSNSSPYLIELDKIMKLIADRALFINPTGRYSGKEVIRHHLMQIAAQGIQFDLWDFRATGGCVTYQYRVLQDNSILDTSNDGLTILEGGKIIFDGTVRSAPPKLLVQGYQAIDNGKTLEIVQAFWQLLNSASLASAETPQAISLAV
jgi:DNA-binding SARP family transcriptional activator